MSDLGINKVNKTVKLFTIGFATKSAEEFFENLRRTGVRRIIDVRLNNVSQLAGFTKKRDIEYFLQTITAIKYTHDVELAPTKELLDGYLKKSINWNEYERRFLDLMKLRNPDKRLCPDDLDHACLLCSEPKADQCHRRLVAEFLRSKWESVEIHHL